ncbi:MAG: hypothetical protein AUH81_08820 [Candidatus Rokubacteria bacterium 13_1_40CM_4_69_5]|nr:MAG: hypothetical protein AUH81_08820 [Candidatus Rokubacteria bacterium 13_1_40CM_4_69_5]
MVLEKPGDGNGQRHNGEHAGEQLPRTQRGRGPQPQHHDEPGQEADERAARSRGQHAHRQHRYHHE